MKHTICGFAIKARDGASRASLRQVAEQTLRIWPRRGEKEGEKAARPVVVKALCSLAPELAACYGEGR